MRVASGGSVRLGRARSRPGDAWKWAGVGERLGQRGCGPNAESEGEAGGWAGSGCCGGKKGSGPGGKDVGRRGEREKWAGL